MINFDPLHVAARRGLLDALEATVQYRRSLIVVGAQAVYLRTERARLTLAMYTTDADLLLDPSTLPTKPALEATLTAAGFRRKGEPGSWSRAVMAADREVQVSVDFMVPAAVAPGRGRRSVELVGHDRNATRRVHGLEAALVDCGLVEIRSLDPSDMRAVTASVAGPAALVIAKIHKIAERVVSRRAERTPVDKDAGDVYRLIQATPLAEMTAGFETALRSEVSKSVTESALDHMDRLFGRVRAVGVPMTIRAVGISGEAPETIAAVLVAYTSGLRSSLSIRRNLPSAVEPRRSPG